MVQDPSTLNTLPYSVVEWVWSPAITTHIMEVLYMDINAHAACSEMFRSPRCSWTSAKACFCFCFCRNLKPDLCTYVISQNGGSKQKATGSGQKGCETIETASCWEGKSRCSFGGELLPISWGGRVECQGDSVSCKSAHVNCAVTLQTDTRRGQQVRI